MAQSTAVNLTMKVHGGGGGDGDFAKTNFTPPKTTIFVAIETSESMRGSKIRQVCDSLDGIIDKAPDDVRFVIRKFNENVTTLVAKKKSSLNINRLHNDLIRKCENGTALFDAWCQIINEIPYDVWKMDSAHLIIFTEGEDNCSKTCDLAAVINMINTKLNHKVQLIFIQAGPHREVADAIETQCSKQQCTVIRVEDSVHGINCGFKKAKEKMQFEVNVVVKNQNQNPDRLASQLSGLNLSSGNAIITLPGPRRNLSLLPNLPGFQNTVWHQSQMGNGLITVTPIPSLLSLPAFEVERQNHGYRSVVVTDDTATVVAPRTYNNRGPRRYTDQNQNQRFSSNPSQGQARGNSGRGRGRGRGKFSNNGNTDSMRHDNSKNQKSFGHAPTPPPPAPESGPKTGVQTSPLAPKKFVQRTTQPPRKFKKNSVEEKLKKVVDLPNQLPTQSASALAPPREVKREYPVKVSKIQARLIVEFPEQSLAQLLLDFFRQWGKCKVSPPRVDGRDLTATVTYDSEEQKNYALKFGGQTAFHGTILVVQDPILNVLP